MDEQWDFSLGQSQSMMTIHLSKLALINYDIENLVKKGACANEVCILALSTDMQLEKVFTLDCRN